MLDFSDKQFISDLLEGGSSLGKGGPLQDTVPMSWRASAGISDPMAYAPSLVTKNPNSFFGTIGGMIAGQLGLTGMSVDGSQQPLFRTNWFDRPNPAMTSFEHSRTAENARMMGAIQDAGMSQIGKAFGSVFAPEGLVGKMAYSTDADGRFVQSQFTRDIAKFAERAMSNPMVAGQLNEIVNQRLGYDRGAGANVFAARAPMMAQAIPELYYGDHAKGAAFAYDKNGQLTFDPRSMGKDRELLNRSVASMMYGATQHAMYNGGITKDWDVTHGMTETGISKVLSEASVNGMLDDYSVMSDDDRERQKEADKKQKQINKSTAARDKLAERYEKLKDSGSRSDRKKAQEIKEKLAYYNADIAARMDEKKEIEDKITTHDGGGSFLDMVKKHNALEQQKETAVEGVKGIQGREELILKEIAEIERTGARESSSGHTRGQLEKQLRYVRRELEQASNEVNAISAEQDKLNKQLGESAKDFLKGYTGAVDALKDFTGDEESAVETLNRLTGNKATKEKGAAQRAEDQVRELNVIGMRAGLDPQKMGAIMRDMRGATQNLFGASAQDMALVGGSSIAGQYELLGTKMAAKASVGASSEEDRQLAQKGAEWRVKQLSQSNVGKALVQLRAAYESGSLSEEEYNRYAEAIQQGNEQTRIAAMDAFHAQVYGSKEEGRRQMRSASEMLMLQKNLTSEGKTAIREQSENAVRADDRNAKRETEAKRAESRQEMRLKNAGFSQKEIRETKQEASFEATMETLGQHSDDEDARMARQAMQEEYDAAYQIAIESGKSPEEANKAAEKAAVKAYNTQYKDLLGDIDTEVQQNRSMKAADKLHDLGSATAVGRGGVGSDFSELVSGVEGAAEKDGSVSRENLGVLQKSLTDTIMGMGKEVRDRVGLGGREMRDYQKRISEAEKNGDYEEKARIMGEMFSKLSPAQKKLVQRRAGRTGIESIESRDAREKKIAESDAEMIAVANAATKKLTGKDADHGGGVAQIASGLQSDVVNAVDVKATPEQLAAEKEAREKSRKRNRATGEIVADVATGAAPLSDLVMNPDVLPEERRARLESVANKFGFKINDGKFGADLGGYLGASAEAESGLGPVHGGTAAEISGSMEGGDIIANIMGSSDEQFESYYKSIGGKDKGSWGTDAGDMLRLKHRLNKARSPKERTKIMKEIMGHLREVHGRQEKKSTKIAGDKTRTDESRQGAAADVARRQMGQDALESAMKALDSGAVVLDDETTNRVRGGGGSGLKGARHGGGRGGSDGGAIGQTMERLINQIGLLIAQLRTPQSQGTGVGG